VGADTVRLVFEIEAVGEPTGAPQFPREHATDIDAAERKTTVDHRAANLSDQCTLKPLTVMYHG
jgi:hypothetical protein